MAGALWEPGPWEEITPTGINSLYGNVNIVYIMSAWSFILSLMWALSFDDCRDITV